MTYSLNLGVLPSTQTSENIFGISSFGESQLPSLTSAVPFTAQPLSLLPKANTPQDFFGLSSAFDVKDNKPATLTDFLKSEKPDPAKTVGDFTVDLLANAAGLGQIKTAMDIGKAVHEMTKDIQKGDGSLEDIACKTANAVVKTTVNAAATGVVVGGVELLAGEAALFPPLAAVVIPAALALPDAYATANSFSDFAGKKAEDDCHRLFNSQTK